jgi:hypothetical protein
MVRGISTYAARTEAEISQEAGKSEGSGAERNGTERRRRFHRKGEEGKGEIFLFGGE